MNKTELITETAKKADCTKKDTEAIVNAMFDVIRDALAGGDKVQVIGFGVFSTKTRAGRKGVNPANGDEIDIPEHTLPVFKAGKLLKDTVNK